VNTRRLYRCRHDRQLAGVASGIAEYLDMDPTLIRVLWILSVFFGGFTILLYVILAFVMPIEPDGMPVGMAASGTPAAAAGTEGGGDPSATAADASATSQWVVAPAGPAHAHRARGEGRLGLVTGVALVVFGAIALIGPMFPGWVAAIALWPAFLVALGVGLVVAAARRPIVDA
jgi:phage shock protein PspC (stress-responsive transcriptional regulator)